MRIAIVSPYDLAVPGGVQQHVEYLANALAERGDDLLVLGPGPDPLPAGNTIEQVQRATVGSSTKLRFNASVAPLALVPNSARRTLAALRSFAPDVVHIHEPAVPWVSMAAAARGPRPIVATFHAWSDTDRAYRAARPALSRLFTRLDGFVAVSPAAAAYHAGALGLSEGRFKVIPNGVDVARFRDASPMDGEVDASRPLVLFAGRLEERKGAKVAIAAFVALKATRPRARMVVVGDGPQRAACEAAVPPALRGDVRFVGRVPNSELPRWFRTADIYMAPALGGESFGIVLLEAMAAGAPVLASDIPGYRTAVRDGHNGLLIAPGDARGLGQAAEELLAKPHLRHALVAQAAADVERYDWTKVAAEVREVYGKAVLRELSRTSGQAPPEVGDLSGREPGRR